MKWFQQKVSSYQELNIQQDGFRIIIMLKH